MSDVLREKLDTLALDILGKITVGSVIERPVIDAMGALTTVSKWYAIKNKVSTGEEEGQGIDEYQKRLSHQVGAGGDDPGESDEPGREGGESEPAADAAASGDSAEPEPSGGSGSGGRKFRQARKPGSGDFASGRGDPDNGGAELARFMASLPGNAGGDVGDQHDTRRKVSPVRVDRDSGPSGVEGDGESDLDELVG